MLSLSPLAKRLDDLRSGLLQEEGALTSAEKSLRDLDLELVKLRDEEQLLAQVGAVLGSLSEKILDDSSAPIDKLITAGLKYVFDDNQLAFKTDVSRYRGKTAIKFSLLQDGVEAPIMDSYGGGVIVFVGVLLRIMIIMALKARRVLVLDETLADVSDQYVANVTKFLKKLCNELDFTIVMVTHNQNFAADADVQYQAKEGPNGTTLVKIRG